MIKGFQKSIHFGAGCLCLCLGLIGVVLPLLPTTVFLILSAFFFAKGSPRARRWLLEHKRFGPPIQAWEATGAIAPNAKRIAIIMMLASFGLSYWMGASLNILIIQTVCLCGAAIYVLSRPSA